MRGSPMDDEKALDTKHPAPDSGASGQSPDSPMKWFVLKVQSNREKSIRESILRRIKMEDMQECFGEIVIPTEKVVDTKGGRRVREQKVLPGYMMIQMVMNDETWHLVRSTSGVGDFTGAAGKPIAMEDHEVRRWLARGEEAGKPKEDVVAKPVVRIGFAIGDHVKVKEGAFESFEGTVDSMDELTGKIKVIVEIFSRPTQVELDHWQVEKV